MKKRSVGIAKVLLFLAVLLAFSAVLTGVADGQGEQSRLQAEESLRRAAVTCYAVEGVYPPNLEYLRRHYGIQVDEEQYHVFYEIFGSNIMPQITVVERTAP